MKNSAVLVIREVDLRVEPDNDLEVLALVGFDVHVLAGLQVRWNVDVEGLVAGEPEALGRLTWQVLQWHDAHAHEVRAVNAFVRLGNDGADA